MLDKFYVYNVLAEGMYFFHCWPDIDQIPHVIFETSRQFLYKFCTIL